MPTLPVAAEADPPTVAILTDAALSAADRADRLLPLVYDQLRSLARRALQAEAPGHTLQATALVHEAFLKLVGPRQLPWQNRAHYFAAAAEAMRQILIDHARRRAANKRGGPEARRAAVELADLPDPASPVENAGLLVLDAALQRLRQVDAEAASVVQLRYFAGLGVEETGQALGISPATVKRTWAFARGWLKEAIDSRRDED